MAKFLRKIQYSYKKFCLKRLAIQNFGFLVNDAEAVILGNGPSLLDSLNSFANRKFIQNRKKFCVNEFINSEDFFVIKPDFLVVVDPVYWAKDKDCSDNFIKKFAEIKRNLSKVNWPLTIFTSKYGKEWNIFMEAVSSNNNLKIIYINTNDSRVKDQNLRFLEYRINSSMPCVQNVLVAAIFLAINIGFKKTYLFGADHSWHESLIVDKNNVVCLKDSHFYDKEEIKYIPFFKDEKEVEAFKMDELFLALSKKYQSYIELESYAKFMGKKIYNASKKSYIDAFERIDIL